MAFGLLLVLLTAAILRVAWVGDDAYITLRTVENMVNGNGPVWNAADRVQTYTHPLWMLVLSLVRLCTPDHYSATISSSVIFAALGAITLARLAGPRFPVVFTALMASGAYCDYATSGLETPLTGFLLATLAMLDSSQATSKQRTLTTSLCIGLIVTTRMDLAILTMPLLALQFVRDWRRAALGMLPLVAWVTFATVYYGSPFPITAYAKALANSVDPAQLVQQGLIYVRFTLHGDPMTLLVIAVGIAVGVSTREVAGRLLSIGAIAYLAYTIRIGGDFMGGRFFVPPFVIATALTAKALALGGRRSLAITTGLMCAAFASFCLRAPGYLPWSTPPEEWSGIIDERRFYEDIGGLFSPNLRILEPSKVSKSMGEHGRTRPTIQRCGMAGRAPFECGPKFHFVDNFILDPFLMRLPQDPNRPWRIGHFPRAIPDGYLETLAREENCIEHPGLARFYDDLRKVVRGPVFSADRWSAMMRVWVGHHDEALRDFVDGDYRNPPERAIDASRMARGPLPENVLWNDDPESIVINRGSLRVRFPQGTTGSALRMWVTPWTVYNVRFFSGSSQTWSTGFAASDDIYALRSVPEGWPLVVRLTALREGRVSIPSTAGAFDSILITAEEDLNMTIAAVASIVVDK